MWVFPMSAAIVSSVFATLLAQQWLSKQKPHQLAWAAALVMFAVASFSAAIGVLGGWNSGLYRIFYLFGAMINVPFLALGTLYLLAPRPVGHVFAALCVVGVIFAAGAIFAANINHAALATNGIPRASEVLGGSSKPRDLFRYYSYSSILVVGGALWSAWRLTRDPSETTRRLASANILIAVGTLVVGLASGLVRFARGSIFSIGLLVGVSVMFVGFLRARTPSPEPPAGEQ